MNITPKLLKKLRNVAIRTLKKHHLPPDMGEDMVQAALLKHLANNQEKKEKYSLEQHLTYLTVRAVQHYMDTLKSGLFGHGAVNSLLLINIPEPDPESLDYQACVDKRALLFDELIADMREIDQQALRGAYYEQKNARTLSKEWGVAHITARVRIQTARKRFATHLPMQYYPPGSDPVPGLSYVEAGNKWPVKYCDEKKTPFPWYKTENMTSPTAFFEESGERVFLLNQAEELKKRCQTARQQKTHSAASPCPTETPPQNETQS